MELITKEKGLALIERYQYKNLKELDINDRTARFESLMKDRQFAYHFEASTNEPSYYGANRSRLLLEQIIPEIEELGKQPVYYFFTLLAAPGARFMIDDFDAMSDFLQANDGIEIAWTLHENEVDGEPNTITMHLIAIMD
jgi:hypothetical protein